DRAHGAFRGRRDRRFLAHVRIAVEADRIQCDLGPEGAYVRPFRGWSFRSAGDRQERERGDQAVSHGRAHIPFEIGRTRADATARSAVRLASMPSLATVPR